MNKPFKNLFEWKEKVIELRWPDFGKPMPEFKLRKDKKVCFKKLLKSFKRYLDRCSCF